MQVPHLPTRLIATTFLLLPATFLLALGSVGCLHTNTVLPGVLDLRSDGSSASSAKDKVKATEATRDGFGSLLQGDGLVIAGEKVTVEDRNWHLLGLFHIINDHGEAEYAALPKDGALRNVMIGDKWSFLDIAMQILPGYCLVCPPVMLLAYAPHYTLTMTGTRVVTGAEPVVPGTIAPLAPTTDPNQPAPLTPEASGSKP